MKKALYIFVVFIGFLQIIGYLTKVSPIRSLGIVTASSPLPIVFTEVKGVETFASNFYIRYNDHIGQKHEVQITPEIYAKFKGPYNRRNIYGAAISYGPVLPKKIWKSVLSYGLCNDILKDELEVPVTPDSFSIYIETRTAGKKDTWELKTTCEQ